MGCMFHSDSLFLPDYSSRLIEGEILLHLMVSQTKKGEWWDRSDIVCY